MSVLDDDLIENNNVLLMHETIKWLRKYSWPSTLKSHISFSISFIKEELFSSVELIADKNIITLIPYYNYPILLDKSVKGNIPDYINVSKCQIFYYEINED